MKKKKRKYTRTGCLSWAVGRLWGINRKYVFYSFAAVPAAVLLPLMESLFTRELLDGIVAGMGFGSLAILVAVFLGGITAVELLQQFVKERSDGLRYYPTSVYQSEMAAFTNYETDYENTETQEFQKIYQYAKQDSCQGDCALEFFSRDLTQALIHFCGIVTYASLLVSLEPVIFIVTAAVSMGSYFTTRCIMRKISIAGRRKSEKRII